jgi:hypothetical protein
MQININMGPISSDDTVQMRLYCQHFRDPYYLHIQGEVKTQLQCTLDYLGGDYSGGRLSVHGFLIYRVHDS